MSDSCQLPAFDIDTAARVARERFAIEGPIEALDGERDLNFLIRDRRGKFVFKIANALESPAMLECQHQALALLAADGVFDDAPTPLPSVDGKQIEFAPDPQGRRHACRVLPFIDGRVLADFETPSAALLEDLGRRLARLDRALHGFDHPALQRPLLWKMDDALEVLDEFKPLLGDSERLALVEHFEGLYRVHASPRLAALRRTVIHNDANRGNVLVDEAGQGLVGLIDFGDMVESWLVVEPAIAATYAMLDRSDPLARAAEVVRGYHGEMPLTAEEIALVYDFVCMRLCASVCINAHQRRLEPDNIYLDVDVDSAWALMRELAAGDPDEDRARILAACDAA